jgi:hypothetical protein
MLKIDGFRSTERAINHLGMGEHLWVRGIEDVLIYVHRLGETHYQVGVCLFAKIASHFNVRRFSIDAKVGQGEVHRLVKKLSARPCKVVNSSLVDRLPGLNNLSENELSYQDFVNAVKNMGLRVQVNP